MHPCDFPPSHVKKTTFDIMIWHIHTFAMWIQQPGTLRWCKGEEDEILISALHIFPSSKPDTVTFRCKLQYVVIGSTVDSEQNAICAPQKINPFWSSCPRNVFFRVKFKHALCPILFVCTYTHTTPWHGSRPVSGSCFNQPNCQPLNTLGGHTEDSERRLLIVHRSRFQVLNKHSWHCDRM